MDCVVREWGLDDTTGLAEMLNNKNIQNKKSKLIRAVLYMGTVLFLPLA